MLELPISKMRNISRNLQPDAWKGYMAKQSALLPKIPDVESLSSRVIRIQAGNPGDFQLQGTSTFLIGTGRSRILIDTGEGVPIWLENLVSVLQENDLEISHVLLTHWHGDHTGGVPQLVHRYPHLSACIYKNQPDKLQQPIYDGQTFVAEGATLRALWTPGHSTDHMCFVLEEEKALFTGDNVLGHGYTVVEDLRDFMASLGAMQTQGCGRGYPAHGAVINDLPARLALYLGRWQRRERQVLAALERRAYTSARNGACSPHEPSLRGGATVAELVQDLYGAVSVDVSVTALQPAILENLQKLAEDGMVGFRLGRVAASQRQKKYWFVLAAGC